MAGASSEEIARLETLYAENPRGRVFTHLAEAHRKNGEPARAREILRRGLADHPDYASAHVVLGRVLEDLGDRDGAVTAFERVLSLDPHNMVALRRLAVAADEAGRSENALEHWSALAALDPGDEEVEARVAALSAPAEGAGRASSGPEMDVPEEPGAVVAPTPEEDEDPFAEELVLDERAPGAWADSQEWAEAIGPEPLDDAIDVEMWGGTAAETGEAEPSEGEQVARAEASAPSDAAAPEPSTPEEPAAAAWDAAFEDEGLPLIDLSVTDFGVPEAGDAPTEAIDGPLVEGDTDTPSWPELGPRGPVEPDVDQLSGVETETLADLYAAQGLHVRAASVYRRLLERKPGDPRLQTKLFETESRVAEGEAGPVRPERDDVAGAGGRRQPPAGAEVESAAVDAPPVEPESTEAAAEAAPLLGPDEATEETRETFVDPFAYGRDETAYGAVWEERDAAFGAIVGAFGEPADSAAEAATDSGHLWTGEEFAGTAFGTEPHGGPAAREPRPGGAEVTPAEPEAAEPVPTRGESVPAGVGEAPGVERPSDEHEDDALAAALASALRQAESGASIRDTLRGIISWSPATDEPVKEPWTPVSPAPAPAPVAPEATADTTPEAPAPSAPEARATAPPEPVPDALESPAAEVEQADEIDLEAEPWAATPSSGERPPGDVILELGPEDLVRPPPSDPGARGAERPAVAPARSAAAEARQRTAPEGAVEGRGELGDLARSLLDASVGGAEATPDDEDAEAGDDEELEVFRSWLQSLKK